MNEQVEKTSISIYPSQRQIVEVFAEEQNRSFSNALQFIIDDWARLKRSGFTAVAPVEPEAVPA